MVVDKTGIKAIDWPQNIDIKTGQVRQFSDGKIHFYGCERHRVSFPEPGNPITPEEAASKWLETSTLRLAYIIPSRLRHCQACSWLQQGESAKTIVTKLTN